METQIKLRARRITAQPPWVKDCLRGKEAAAQIRLNPGKAGQTARRAAATSAILTLLVLVFALAASAQCCAQTVALSIVRLDCSAPLSPLFSPPATPQEREQISAEWTGADELAVDAWDEETADSVVDPATAKVHLDGSALTLTYSRRPTRAEQTKQAPKCQSLVKLFFTISDLPRSHYSLRLEDAQGRVHQLEIDG